MRKVLIIAPTFLPGNKGGGPVQSVKNIVTNLSDDFDFYIFTSDRDKGDQIPYPDIIKDEWIEVENYKIFYTSNKKMNNLKKIILDLKPEVIYLNSFFSWTDSIKIILLCSMMNFKGKVLLAPRGEFDKGALKIKKVKKKIFLSVFNLLKVYQNINWHATSKIEKKHILEVIPKAKEISIANNLTSNYDKFENFNRFKKPGCAKLIFISRITRKKNLLMVLRTLEKIKIGQIELNIYGPIEDVNYWEECNKVIKQLPSNIKATYFGEISQLETRDAFSKNHFFFFPTFGENYGHVISESLISGCPVIISKETPWLELNKENVGWDIDLSDEMKFIEIIEECVKMNQISYNNMSENAFEYAKKQSDLENRKMETKKMLV